MVKGRASGRRLRNQIDNLLASDRALSLVVAIETALEDKRFEVHLPLHTWIHPCATPEGVCILCRVGLLRAAHPYPAHTTRLWTSRMHHSFMFGHMLLCGGMLR